MKYTNGKNHSHTQMNVCIECIAKKSVEKRTTAIAAAKHSENREFGIHTHTHTHTRAVEVTTTIINFTLLNRTAKKWVSFEYEQNKKHQNKMKNKNVFLLHVFFSPALWNEITKKNTSERQSTPYEFERSILHRQNTRIIKKSTNSGRFCSHSFALALTPVARFKC